MSTPANDLAAKIAAAIMEMAYSPSDTRSTEDVVRAELAPTLDALAAAQQLSREIEPMLDKYGVAMGMTRDGVLEPWPLLDRVKIACMSATDNEDGTPSTLDLREQLYRAESALRLAREALEQVAEPQPMMSIAECASKRRRIAEQAIAALDRITGKLP